MSKIADAGRRLLGLPPGPSEREHIEGESDLGAAKAALSKLVEQEVPALEEKLRQIGDDDLHARLEPGTRLDYLRRTLIPAAQMRVSALENEAVKGRRREEDAARLKDDPLYREVEDSHAAVREAEGRLAEVEALLSGAVKDPQGVSTLPSLSREGRYRLERERSEVWDRLLAAKEHRDELSARLKARDDGERAEVAGRVRAEYAKRSKAWRKQAEAVMQSLAEARRLAQEGRRARLLLPVPGPTPALVMWLDALDRLNGQGDDAA